MYSLVFYIESSTMAYSMSITALRKKLFTVIDQVIETGIPAEIERKGHIVKIVLEEKKSKLDNLKKHTCIVGDPETLVNLDPTSWEETEKL